MPATSESDQHFMHQALDLAREVLGATSPNPAVGCVIVRDRRIVGKGATASGGRPHAETRALAAAGNRASGATAYVSFEPCAHHGQTPPCAQALIDARLSRVVVGCVDPYREVSGRGIAMIRRAGISVTTGVLEDECRRLNEGFIKRVTLGRPFVTLKLAMSLDGRIAAAGGDSEWISSAASRELVHRWRRESDAVMVGAGTVIADNPRLTCRMKNGRDPARVIVDSRLRVPPAARVFHIRSQAPAIVVTSSGNRRRAERRYATARTEVIAAPAPKGEIDLAHVMREFGLRGWSRVMIEGGAHLAGAALRAGVVDRIALFVAPKILGAGLSAIEGLKTTSMSEAITLENLRARPIGDDWLLEGEVRVSRRKSHSAHPKDFA